MKILILDDHYIFSEGLSKILLEKHKNLHIDCYQSIASLLEANLKIKSYDLFISDIELPGENIFELLTQVKNDFKKLPILVVSMHNKLSVIKKCKALGIEGYILKDDNDLLRSIDAVLSGKEYYSNVVTQTLEVLELKGKLLTPREEDIIALVASGKNNNSIAKELFVSVNTVNTHRKNINRKLDLSHSAELVKYYFDNYVP